MGEVEQRDIIMVGGGPGNLAVAVTLEECYPQLAAGALVLERNNTTAWQPGVLFGRARSQVNYLKDLATLRDPRSRFTFLNYLKSVGRLEHFINSGTSTPYRFEISDYHRWVAEGLDKVEIQYGRQVRQCEAVQDADGAVLYWRVTADNGAMVEAPTVIFGAGRDARLPMPLQQLGSHPRVVHSTGYLTALAGLAPIADRVRDIAVIGSAQSSAELFLEAGSDFPHANRTMIMRSIGPVAYESSKFTNELFYTSYVDTFFSMPSDQRRAVLEQMARTNYSAVAPHTLEALYDEKYLADYQGHEQVTFRTMTTIDQAEQGPEGKVTLHLRDEMGRLTREDYDLVLCGTGFEPKPPKLLSQLLEDIGVSYQAGRDYEIPTPGPARLFAQGINEETHGIADSLLSVQAVRANEICVAIAADQGASRV